MSPAAAAALRAYDEANERAWRAHARIGHRPSLGEKQLVEAKFADADKAWARYLKAVA